MKREGGVTEKQLSPVMVQLLPYIAHIQWHMILLFKSEVVQLVLIFLAEGRVSIAAKDRAQQLP